MSNENSAQPTWRNKRYKNDPAFAEGIRQRQNARDRAKREAFLQSPEGKEHLANKKRKRKRAEKYSYSMRVTFKITNGHKSYFIDERHSTILRNLVSHKRKNYPPAVIGCFLWITTMSGTISTAEVWETMYEANLDLDKYELSKAFAAVLRKLEEIEKL